VSLGVQALRDDVLSFLGRTHSAADAIEAIKLSQQIFERSSFDLIYARPGQLLEGWREELLSAIQYASDHLSLYQLTIERNTPFYMRHARGEFSVPDQDLAADFYHLTQDVLGENGLPAYEVSNHARPGEESRHNLVYWHYGDYIGIGPGAHGRVVGGNGQKMATRDHQAPERWLEWVEGRGCGAHEADIITPRDAAVEAFMMGIRLYDGMRWDQMPGDWREVIDADRLDSLVSEGLLCYDDAGIELSREGMLRINAIIRHVIKDDDDTDKANNAA
jgi:oxygen-independent coproporphyrinogen-3 oxidase